MTAGARLVSLINIEPFDQSWKYINSNWVGLSFTMYPRIVVNSYLVRIIVNLERSANVIVSKKRLIDRIDLEGLKTGRQTRPFKVWF